MDFKGWWRARNGQRCEPSTVRDAYSRFVLAAKLMPNSRGESVRRVEDLFTEYALRERSSATRLALRLRQGARWAHAALGLVGVPRHPADSLAPSQAAGQRRARAHAPRHDRARARPGALSSSPAARLRPMARRLQQRAAARDARRQDPSRKSRDPATAPRPRAAAASAC